MSTKNGTGTGAPSAANPQKEEKGVAVVKQATQQPNPLEERRMKIAALQRKVVDVQKLKNLYQELGEYELGVDENDHQNLEIKDKHRRSFDTSNPKLIGDVINFIKQQCANKIPQLESELMSATI